MCRQSWKLSNAPREVFIDEVVTRHAYILMGPIRSARRLSGRMFATLERPDLPVVRMRRESAGRLYLSSRLRDPIDVWHILWLKQYITH